MAMPGIRFTKMHGTGNDFVVIDCVNQQINDRSTLAKKICARKFGAGADQLILICPSDTADYFMEIYNPDGSKVEMCGNALRAVALYINKNFDSNLKTRKIDTPGGLTEAVLNNGLVTVNMGPPSFSPEDIGLNSETELVDSSYKFADGIERNITCVSMGNPHCIQLVDDVETCPLESEGPLIENHSLFKNRTNVEFIYIVSATEVDMRVWERGTGETLACGSGACAVGAAVIKNGLTERKIQVNLKGGTLIIEWNENDNCIYMTGPAVFVYEGSWNEG